MDAEVMERDAGSRQRQPESASSASGGQTQSHSEGIFDLSELIDVDPRSRDRQRTAVKATHVSLPPKR